ncbi:adenomatous polyposis coli protein-like [Anopheles marshallii]|uniref:adenomatous polyposis coli protein-like n=1 Tax=Anopheles marshallii TaxID=1521116 RepID=UPI00237B7817|nr:adenomatous polyposis coli protein-like [Anopheles marshallii]
MPKPSEESYGSLGKPDSSLDDDFELDELAVSRKPHFLDYDNKSPAELVEQHHCWNGAEKEEETEVGEEKKQEVDVPLGTVMCEHSFLYQRAPVAPEGTATIPIMNVSYDITTATVTTLNILPAKKQGAVVNGTRGGGGGTWPLKERPVTMSPRRQQQQEQQPQQQHHSLNRGELGEVGPKMECVYSLLSMLGSTNVLEMSCKFLELSRNEEKCSALRRSGCVPLLVHIIHNEPNEVARRNARHALVNVVRCNVDEGSARRELKVLRLIDQLIDYTDMLKEQTRENGRPEAEDTVLLDKEPPVGSGSTTAPDPERHPIQAIGTLAKISYDEEHRHAMCQFGALQTIASLIQLDHHAHGNATPDALKCVELRRYASMVLTNLTFGQGNNKALLCSNREFMRALVSQLSCTELVQVTASVLRNLSWRADAITKQTLVEIETVTLLMEAAMRCTVENTLKSILSALWNLSNHCAQNRAKVCEVTGALEFLIDLLTYEAPSKTWSIVENAGGILRNVSSHIAQCEQFRQVLREKQCLKLLLDQLKSPSLTVVSNACGTLGNLSSENDDDQRFLREHGAIPMLRSLIYSKHNIISNGSRLALKNLQQQHRPPVAPVTNLHETHPDTPGWNGKVDGVIVPPGKGGGGLPGLNVRKQRAMEQELGCAFYRKQTDTGQDTGGEEVHTVRDVVSSPDRDPEPETPINYGLSEERLHQHSYDYQETDIDQLTDYSLRYAENQSDSEEDEEEKDDERGVAYRRRASGNGDPSVNVLMPEDSVKCYYTEGTPQIISSATSMSDLRAVVSGSQMKPVEAESVATTVVVVASDESIVGVPVIKSNPIPIGRGLAVGDDMGCNTPDKPFNYCEEGTPDFSREASLSIIDLSHHTDERRADEKQQHQQRELDKHQQQQHTKLPTPTTVVVGDPNGSISGPVGKSVSFLNTGGADETPLMFSRTSSMGSLSSAEPACTDDKSSIVSEFSRMASGVMSPSELPDSPTQTIPHSPHPQPKRPMLPKTLPPDEDGEGRATDGESGCGNGRVGGDDGVGAFADTVSKFNVEHTPAQFSCATSLSNLSLEEKEEIKQEVEQQQQHQQHHHGLENRMEEKDGVPSQPPILPNPADVLLGMMNGTTNATTTDEGHASDVDSDAGGGEDDELLASCISIGMNSVAARSVAKQHSSFQAASMQSLRYRDGNDRGNDSDDSSNLSDSNDLLEECILSGMPKPKQSHPLMPPGGPVMKENPFKMMRTNHTMVAPANDELNPFHIEDSPCNFSTISALSELTMASDTNATSMHDKSLESIDRELIDSLVKDGFPKKRELVVSSPSVESETDDHLLDEAIAAGITGKVQQARGNVTDGTKQPKNDTFERCEATTSGGWISPPQAQRTNDDSLPDDNDDSEQEEDYQLLVECIQKGMRPVGPAKSGAPVVTNYHDDEELLPLTVGGMMQRPNHITTNPTKQTSHPKNVQTTPAMSKGVGAFEVSPGVGSKQNCLPSARSINGGRQRAPEAKPSPAARSQPDTSDSTDTTIYFSLPSSVSTTSDSTTGVAPSGTITGADMRRDHEQTMVEEVTMPSARTVLIGSEKDRRVSETGVGDLSIDSGTCAKHKNPERMLRSVERLTQELVAQVEERHVRTDLAEGGRIESVAVFASTALEFKIGEVVTNIQGGSGVGLNAYLQDNARVEDLEEVNLESEEPPSILYKLSMPYVQHDVAGPGIHDCSSLAPIEEQPNRAKPARVVSNPGSPRILKMQRESTITKEIDECKGKPIKALAAKSLKKEQQTTSIKPVAEGVAKFVRGRQAMSKVVIATGRSNTKPSTGSPIHRPTGKTILPVHSQRGSPNVTGTMKKHQPEAKALRNQTIKPAAGIARQDTFVLDKPTLTVHVPKLMPTVGSTATDQAGTDIKSNTSASKIPLAKGEKISKPSRIPPPKRTLAGKQSSKCGVQKSPPLGGVQRK